MFKTVIAGATALTLTLTAPVQAKGLSEDQIGQLVFGLFATAAIAHLVDNNVQARTAIKSQPKATPRRHGRGVANQVRQQARMTLPARCKKTFETRRGEVRMFTRTCINRHYDFRANFPERCEVSVRTTKGRRNGWKASCMKRAGFRVDRQR